MGHALKWIDPTLAVFFVVFGVFVHVFSSRSQKQIIQRAKTAGITLSVEDKNRINDLDAMKEKALRSCGLMALAMLMITISAWL